MSLGLRGTSVGAPILEKPNRFSGIRATSGSQWVDYALTLQPDHLTGQTAVFLEQIHFRPECD